MKNIIKLILWEIGMVILWIAAYILGWLLLNGGDIF